MTVKLKVPHAAEGKAVILAYVVHKGKVILEPQVIAIDSVVLHTAPIIAIRAALQ